MNGLDQPRPISRGAPYDESLFTSYPAIVRGAKDGSEVDGAMFEVTKRVFSDGNRDVRGRIAGMFVFLAAVNIGLWGLALVTFRHYPVLLGTCFLAYGFGLRHAVDADHIAAIDNVTRKLMQQGGRPVGVGCFFSLGHSTIVFGLSAAVAATAVAIKNRFGAIENFGNVAGTLMSAFFLLAIAVMNILVLLSIVRTFRKVKAGGVYVDEDLNLLLARRGFFGRLFRGLFRLVDHSWQMYPVGVLFGLGFDTATEVGLLGISAAEASKGLPIWSIMVFPALFAAGMALIDTTDSIMMLGAYGWAFAKPLRKLYYNITITSVSVLVALIVGGLETLGLIQGELNLSGPLWDPVAALNNNFGTLGYVIIGIFMLSWIVSVLLYKMKRYDDIEVTLAE
jgi:nickel/cobalt transporter (NiCoT) family protein